MAEETSGEYREGTGIRQLVVVMCVLIHLSLGFVLTELYAMNYWLLCLPREDLEHCMRIGTFGLARKHILGHVLKDDAVVCCAGKGDWKIIGLGLAISDYYVGDKSVFLKEGLFPDRFDFKADKMSIDREIDIKSIIDRLSFVTNVAYWMVFFRNGIVRMSKQDWELISKLTSETAAKRN